MEAKTDDLVEKKNLISDSASCHCYYEFITDSMLEATNIQAQTMSEQR
jgi:hypothetical protein